MSHMGKAPGGPGSPPNDSARGVDVEVFERAANVGGHSRSETLNGVAYEPNGAHIFHISNEHVADYVERFGLSRPYEHCVKTQVHLGDDHALTLLSWPPQLEELRSLRLWPTIEKELTALPATPARHSSSPSRPSRRSSGAVTMKASKSCCMPARSSSNSSAPQVTDVVASTPSITLLMPFGGKNSHRSRKSRR